MNVMGLLCLTINVILVLPGLNYMLSFVFNCANESHINGGTTPPISRVGTRNSPRRFNSWDTLQGLD